MNLGDVRQRIEEIKRLGQFDDEGAHSKEDQLWADVLQAIADGSPDAQALAGAALESNTIEFSRWCA